MIIPLKDQKLSQFKHRFDSKKIHVFSNYPKNINHINSHVQSKSILLNTCVEKEYVIGFDINDISQLKRFETSNYKLREVDMNTLLKYCCINNNNLLILQKNDLWLNINPFNDTVMIHDIMFKK